LLVFVSFFNILCKIHAIQAGTHPTKACNEGLEKIQKHAAVGENETFV